MSKTEPTVAPALAALEPLAAALLADLAARGVPADELPEVVVLALAAQQERINDLHAICRALHGRLERMEEMIRRPGDIPIEEYQRRVERLGLSPYWGMVDFAGNPLPDDGPISAADPPAPAAPPPVRASLVDLDSAPDVESRDAIVREIASRAGVPAPIGRWHVSYVTDPAPLSRIDARVRVRGGAGRWYTFPVFEDGEVGRAMPEPGQESSTPPEAPRFRHDCPDCTFLGRSADGTRDLYWCRDSELPLSIYGDSPGKFDRRDRETGYPAEAYRRAVAAGLVGEGEGGPVISHQTKI